MVNVSFLGLKLLLSSTQKSIAHIELKQRALTNEMGRLRYQQRSLALNNPRRAQKEKQIRSMEVQLRKLDMLKDKYLKKHAKETQHKAHAQKQKKR